MPVKQCVKVVSDSETDDLSIQDTATFQDTCATVSVAASLPGVIVGRLVRFDDLGTPLVDFPSNPSCCPLPARSTIALTEASVGSEAVLAFEQGELTRPLVIGIIQPTRPPESYPSPCPERLQLQAGNEIVLRCGKASIQLLSDGSVRIRGTNVLSRASATNRIRGGNVQIN